MSETKYKILYFTLIVLCTSDLSLFAQNSIDDAIKKYNSGSIDYINVNELNSKLNHDKNLVLLDSRSLKEYDVSHLKNAIWIGYKTLNTEAIEQLKKDQKLIVYCSIGVRSEQVGEQLKAMGFTDIKNLYGGIFEWSNQGFTVYNNDKQTQNVHPYDKFWGKFLQRGHKVLE